jgi:hypothetical protein
MVKLLELNIPKTLRKSLVYHHHLQEQLHNYNHSGPSPPKEKRNCLAIFGPSPPKLLTRLAVQPVFHQISNFFFFLLKLSAVCIFGSF